jgi:hypothetical protein
MVPNMNMKIIEYCKLKKNRSSLDIANKSLSSANKIEYPEVSKDLNYVT